MATVKDNLIAAKALIDTPAKWIKGTSELDGCFCAIGALNRISPPLGHYDDLTPPDPAYEALVSALPDGECFVARFNDEPATTHADIMDLFDRAIAAQSEAET